MAVNALSNPTIEVNDITIRILPNTLSYKLGKGDVNVRAQSAGGNSVESVFTEDAETKISMVKFSMTVTDVNRDLVESWQENRFQGGNTIRFSEKTSTKPLSFAGMVVMTDPEYSVGADSTVEIEFEGDAA
ncbi:MAG: hypothetical protein ACUZ8E_17470 [Candidatus Anammoxibacter sp.]